MQITRPPHMRATRNAPPCARSNDACLVVRTRRASSAGSPASAACTAGGHIIRATRLTSPASSTSRTCAAPISTVRGRPCPSKTRARSGFCASRCSCIVSSPSESCVKRHERARRRGDATDRPERRTAEWIRSVETHRRVEHQPLHVLGVGCGVGDGHACAIVKAVERHALDAKRRTHRLGRGRRSGL